MDRGETEGKEGEKVMDKVPSLLCGSCLHFRQGVLRLGLERGCSPRYQVPRVDHCLVLLGLP